MATAAPWDSGYHHSSLLVAVGASATDANKTMSSTPASSSAHVTNFFSSTTLDTALSMSFQPSTSQTGSNMSVSLAPNDVSAAKTKTNINTTASTSTENDNIANSNLARGLSSTGFRNSNASGTGNALPATLAPTDTDADDPDVGRLQALLEARGIPPQVFGSLGESKV